MKNVLIVGSLAVKLNMNRLGNPGSDIETNDVDVICKDGGTAFQYVLGLKDIMPQIEHVKLIKHEKFSTFTEVLLDKETNTHYEVTYPYTDFCTTARLFDPEFEGKHIDFDVESMYASLDTLYMLKMSHRYLKDSPHFLKTMHHCKYLRKMGATITNESWFKSREKETYDYGHYKLDTSSKEFFTTNFNYIYDHDSIHEAVAFLERPAYTYYMEDDAEVMCSKDKFFALEKAHRYLGVLEEAYVLALERSQIPNDFKVDPKTSFTIALEKVCTSITSGWFREFAWEHYDVLIQLYNEDYVTKFKQGLENGTVKLHGYREES